jgi:preprotein translocase subunit SecE
VAKAAGGIQDAILGRFVRPILEYLRDTRAELRKVTWPTRKEAQHLTLIVLGATAGMAVILGLADYAFGEIMRGLVLGSWTGYLAALVATAAGVASWYMIRGD